VSLYTRRLLVNRVNLLVSLLAMVFGLFWLGVDSAYPFRGGLQQPSRQTCSCARPPPGSTGGLLNAIAVACSLAVAGTCSARQSESWPASISRVRARRGWLAPVTRFINDILLSAPSIVVGLFIYQAYVVHVRHFSAWAGIMALALIVIPVVIRTTENMLRLVPDSLREAAAALGARNGRSSAS